MKKLFLLFTIVLLFISCKEQLPDDVVEDYIPPPHSVVDKQFNFHIVDAGVWRSSQPNRESIIRMKEHGLKTIINLRGDAETDLWEGQLSDSLNICYVSSPLDANKEMDMNQLKDILEIVEDSTLQPILIHCLGGKDRTGLIVGMYKLKNTNQSIDEIKKEMIMYGHDASFEYVFEALDQFNNELSMSR